MNIVEMHERVRYWIDTVASTRFDSTQIDNALNIAIENKVRESYDMTRPMNLSDAFQRVQRVRDELQSLVKKLNTSDGIVGTPSGEEIIATIADTVTDYGWTLSVRVKVVGSADQWYPCYPTAYNEIGVLHKNPFRRPRTTPDIKFWYVESAEGMKIIPNVPFEDIEIYYLAVPPTVFYGIEYDNTKTFTVGSVVYASSIDVMYNGQRYGIGQQIEIVTGFPSVTTGFVVSDYVNCILPQTTHEEITRRAGVNCLLTAGQHDKAEALRKEIVTVN